MFLFEAIEKLFPKKITPIAKEPVCESKAPSEKKYKNYNQNSSQKVYPEKNKTYFKPNKEEISPPTQTSNFSAPDKPKGKFVKTESAYVLFINSYYELSVMLNNEKTSINISGLEDIYEKHAEHSGSFQKFVKNFLYESVRKQKIFLRFDENSKTDAQIYFDFKCQDSLLERLSEAAQNFQPNTSPKTEYKFKT